jgi:hypothetical protein
LIIEEKYQYIQDFKRECTFAEKGDSAQWQVCHVFFHHSDFPSIVWSTPYFKAPDVKDYPVEETPN